VAVNNVSVASAGSFGHGYLCALDSTTLAMQSSVFLNDPRPTTGSPLAANVTDDSSASPTVGPDGHVYYGVMEGNFPSNNDRGWLLHFSGDLLTTKLPGAFGWDDTASIVPAAAVPSYTGPSSYLLLTKYNNYAGIHTGDGVNRLALVDPNTSFTDPVTGATAMNPFITVKGVTPDPEYVAGYPNAVREWCINSAAVDPVNHCAMVNSEDGKLYRWDFTKATDAPGQLYPGLDLAPPTGEAYTPTVIGPDGAVYAINNATLFSVITEPQTRDFNGDGKADFLLYNASIGRTYLWYQDGPTTLGGTYGPNLPAGWAIIAVADFNGDGKPDFLLYNASISRTYLWYQDGPTTLGGTYGPTLPAGWAIIAVADFNGDGKPDFLLYNAGTQRTYLWYRDGPTTLGGTYGPTVPAGWAIIAVADFNGDGKADFLLYNASASRTYLWYQDGPTMLGGTYGPTLPAGWAIMAAADFNGDGKPDILFYNASTSRTYLWYQDGPTTLGGTYGPTVPAGWAIMAAADFNGDGKPDILFYNASTSRTYLWYQDGPTMLGGTYGPTLPVGWALVAP
jgi:hypothetical protein